MREQPVGPTEFLLARIAEDEAMALAVTPGPWCIEKTSSHMDRETWAVADVERFCGYTNHVSCGEDKPLAEFVARHDPARVLAECEAKRGIVAHVADAEKGAARALRFLAREGNDSRDAQEQEFAAGAKLDAVTCIAKHVAAIYADHPDYDSQWKP